MRLDLAQTLKVPERLGWQAMDTVDVPGAVYLDHAATTPMVPAAVAAMTEQLRIVGNPSSLHRAGRTARRVVEESRETIAQALGARPSEVVFTSGGTEADNLAVKGLFWSRRAADPRRVRILASAVEHHAVLDCVEWLASHDGAKPVWLDVDQLGRVRPETVRAAIESDPSSVALVTVMWANNEVGTVQPISDIVAIAHSYGIPGSLRRRAGGRPAAHRLRGERPRRVDHLRSQGRRPARCRRIDRGARTCTDAGLARRWAGARPALGHSRHPGDRRFRGRGRRRSRVAAGACGRSGRTARRPRTAGADRRPRCRVERRPWRWCSATGCRATRTSDSPAAKATRC